MDYRYQHSSRAVVSVMRANPYHRKCWLQHKASAKQRGIGFHLAYADWMRIWRASGHLHQRGTVRGAYVMGRIGDVGPYASSNVRVISIEEKPAAGCGEQKTPRGPDCSEHMRG